MINRQDFLKLFAATSCMNLSTIDAFGTESKNAISPRRFVFIRKANGLVPSQWELPTFSDTEKKMNSKKEAFEVDLDKHDFTERLAPLVNYKSNLCILHGLSSKMSENGHGSGQSVMGAFNAGGSINGISRATIDFELAKLFPSPFGHVELTFNSQGGFGRGIIPGFSAPRAKQKNFAYADPETAYNELFKAVVNPKALSANSMILEQLVNLEKNDSKTLTGYEKFKIDQHVESINSFKKRDKKLVSMAKKIARFLPKLDPIHLNGGPTATTMQKQDAMTDILVASLAAGLTNVVTYTIDTLPTPITGLPGNEADHIGLHPIGHARSYSGVPGHKIQEKVDIRHVQQVARIADKLKAIPEGQGNMFDNTVIMYFPEGGEGHHGLGFESPWVVLAGDKCKLDMFGRYIRLPYHGTKGHKTLGNWYTTLLNAYGNPIEHYGDLDTEMSRKRLDQTGAIKQFLVNNKS